MAKILLYHRSIPKLFIDDGPQQVANIYIYIDRLNDDGMIFAKILK